MLKAWYIRTTTSWFKSAFLFFFYNPANHSGLVKPREVSCNTLIKDFQI
jgi:hypothetical protein